jgi:hypothetical protein
MTAKSDATDSGVMYVHVLLARAFCDTCATIQAARSVSLDLERYSQP